jgi:hypothetical protein
MLQVRKRRYLGYVFLRFDVTNYAMLGEAFVTTAWRVFRLGMEGNCEYMNNQSRTADKGWSFSVGLTHCKNKLVTKMFKKPRTWTELNSGNACYHSVQNLLSSRLLSRNRKIRIYKTIILPVVLCGCETWSLTLREEHRLRVFENRVLRRISGPKRDEVTGGCRKLHN